MNELHCQCNTSDILKIQGKTWQVTGQLLPEMTLADPTARTLEQQETLGGIRGRSHSRLSSYGPWQINREVFIADDATVVAMRVHLLNSSDSDQVLDDVNLFEVTGEAHLKGAGQGMTHWRIVRMSRQKNDVPGNFKPGVQDMDMEHARIDGAELKAGRGVSAQDLANLKVDMMTIPADPGFWFKDRQDASAQALCMSMLGQTEHLSHLALSTGNDQQTFENLKVLCEFDGITVRPGQTRRTHWLMIYESDNEEAIRQRQVDMLATELNVHEPTPAPSFFCSWYFYGTDFTQADLDENLLEFKRRPLPFDVLLIDNGWMTDFGDYQANHRFPDGMEHAAQKITEASYRPGIWTCPFVVSHDSPILKKYPNLLARDQEGQLMTFHCENRLENVLDPTSPDAEPYFAELFGKLRSWGYITHKLDFLRAIIVSPRIRFADPTMTRAQAYRRGMQLVRKHAGKDAYILACGGLFEGTAGLVDGIRIGSDTRGHWQDPNGKTAYHKLGYLARIKQNIFRNHTNRLWHTDPDAMQLRRRNEPFRGHDEYFHLSEGSFTDDEAMTLLVNQYIGGGAVTICERMVELDDDRYAMLRRVMPPATSPAKVIDFESPQCPTMLWTRVDPEMTRHDPWYTLAVFNWANQPVEKSVRLSNIPEIAGKKQMGVMELVTQSVHGLCDADDSITLTIPAHGVRVLRIAPWQKRDIPLLLGTDGHLSGGAGEFVSFQLTADRCKGQLLDRWVWPLRIWVMVETSGGLETLNLSLDSDAREFDFDLSERLTRDCQQQDQQPSTPVQ